MSQKQRYPSLKFHGNEETMNLNPMIWSNIVSSHYFKRELIQLKDFNAVVDEIYFKVTHLEPWEKGSNIMTTKFKVYRGVCGLGIVSTAFCLLYKLHKLKMNRKQVVKLIQHKDSPYIRALGFLYLRYTQPHENLWGWYKEFVFDMEFFRSKADSDRMITIGEMLHILLLESRWFSAMLPRLPVALMKELKDRLSQVRNGGNPKDRSDLAMLVQSSKSGNNRDSSDDVSSDGGQDRRSHHHNRPHSHKNLNQKHSESSRSHSPFKHHKSESRSRH